MGWQYPEWKSQPIMAGAKSIPSFLATRWTPWTAENCSTSLVSSRHCAIHAVHVAMVTSAHFLCGMLQVGAWMAGTTPRCRTHFEEPFPVKARSGFVTPPNDALEVISLVTISYGVLICPFFIVLKTWLSQHARSMVCGVVSDSKHQQLYSGLMLLYNLCLNPSCRLGVRPCLGWSHSHAGCISLEPWE